MLLTKPNIFFILASLSMDQPWNLIGYDGDINVSLTDTTFHNGSTGYTFTEAVAANKLKNYQSYYDTNAQANLSRFKYLGPANVDDTAFRRNKGYWVYVNASEGGNLTLPLAGGSASGESYDWADLRFSNGSEEKNVTDAGTAGWLNSTTLRSWTSVGRPGFTSITAGGSLNSLQGYFIKSNKDNITLIRQN